MAGGKETPRQRMIGILYLVLLGLIALNVPDSLLDSFKNITRSLDASRINVTTGLDNTYAGFKATKIKEQPEKAGKLLAQAEAATKATGELNSYIEEIKAELIKKGGNINPDIDDVDARESLDISSEVMINGKKADILKEKIEATKVKLLSLLGKDAQGVSFSLNATDPKPRAGFAKKTWQQAYFGEGIPLGAALTTLAKVQADNKNAENEVVKKILGKVDVAQVTLNEFRAVAVAPSSYILSGQPYKAEIYLTAYDAKSNPSITVGGSSIPTANGVGTYTVNTSGEGKRTWTGTLMVKQVDGPPKPYTVTGEYMVAKPSAVVSPDKMNVLYIGVDNPISVSAPGVPIGTMKVSISNGSVSGTNGHYTAKVTTAGTAKVTVYGDKGMVLGATDFRVKRIPDPKPQFAGRSGGKTNAANLRSQERVFAKLENFDFAASFNVTRFTLIIMKPRQDVVSYSTTGADLSSQMRTAMNSVTPGTTVLIQDIIAVGPDGTQRGLDSIVLTAN